MRSLVSSDGSWVATAPAFAVCAIGVVLTVVGARRLLRLYRDGTIRTLSRSKSPSPKRSLEVDLLFRRRHTDEPPPDPKVLGDLADLLRALTILLAGLALGDLGQLCLALSVLHDRTYIVHAVLTPLLAIYAIGGCLLARRADRMSRQS